MESLKYYVATIYSRIFYNAFALAINNHNQIVGWFKCPNSGPANKELNIHYSGLGYGHQLGAPLFLQEEIHAYLWQNNFFTDLGTLGGKSSQATDINDSGQIVGASLNGDILNNNVNNVDTYIVHAFIWENGLMRDLNNLIIDKPKNVELVLATAINNNGQIVGVAKVGTEEHAFLLKPKE